MEAILFILIIAAIWVWGHLSYCDGFNKGWAKSNLDIPYYEREAERKGKVIILLHLQQKGLLKMEDDGTLVGLNGATLKSKVNEDIEVK